MLDVSHIPSEYGSNIQIFKATSVVAGVTWQAWTKPRGASMIHIMLLGGGGAGSAGAANAASTAAGGGGGGSAAQSIAIFPAHVLPDILYVSVGVGGVGTANATGTSGIASYVSLRPLSTPVNHLLMQANGGSAPASRPTNATAGVAGAAGTVTTIANCPGAGLGQFAWGTSATNVSLLGQIGAVGGTTGAGVNITLPVTGLLVTGGASGAGLGGVNSAGSLGGGWTVPAGGFFFPASFTQIAATNTNAPGNMGSNGFSFLNKMFYHYGGTGGGSGGLAASGAATASGGAGGAGGIGCGGGGGGGGFTGATNGQGGNGGDGICIITCW